MRLFVSVDLEGFEDGVAAAQNPLEGLPGLRITDPQQAHLTVKFLGDGPDGDDPDGDDPDHDLEALTDALEAAVAESGIGDFEATFAGLGVFPAMEYIRVVWLGVEAGSERLTALHEAVEERTTALGYEPEDHSFTPHVTLARMDNAAAKSDVREYVRSSHPEVGCLDVEELRLTESTLTPDGPDYETLRRIPLESPRG